MCLPNPDLHLVTCKRGHVVLSILRFTPSGSVPSDIITILQTPSEILTSAYYMQGLPSHFSVFCGWPTSPNCHPVFYFLFFLFRFLPHVCLRTVFRFSLLQWCSFSYWLCNRKKSEKKNKREKIFRFTHVIFYPIPYYLSPVLLFSRVIPHSIVAYIFVSTKQKQRSL